MKKVLFTVICFFILIGFCSANVTTYDRNTLTNYGVNKKWEITPENKNDILNTHAVNANEKIYDFSDILSSADEYYLKQLINNFNKATGFELVILTESFYNQNDDDNGDYAQNFYDYNDFAIDDKYYSGVIILRNTYPGLPYYGVYSFGEAQYYYPAEYSDNRLNYTLDEVYDDMVAGNYKEAMTEIISDLTDYYFEGKESGMENYSLDSNGDLVYKTDYTSVICFSAIAALIITWVYIRTLVKKNTTIHLPRLAHDYLEIGGVLYLDKRDILYNSRTTSYTHSSSYGGSSRGGRSYSSSRGSSGGSRSGGGRRG